MRTSSFFTVRAPMLAGVLSGCCLLLLLGRLLFEGWAHSYDTLLYARSLFGAAHCDPYNPVAGVHIFSIHGHFTSLLLAPLVRFIPAALVLIAAQSVSLAFTVWLVVRAFGRVNREHEYPLSAWKVAAAALFVSTLGTPLLLNPFLFDARPDLVGVPLMTAACLRLEARSKFDVTVAVLFALAVLSREEFAIIVAAVAVFAPDLPSLRDRPRQRIVIVFVSLAYFLFYWFVLRNYFGGELALERAHSASTLFDANEGNAELGLLEIAGYKVEILLVAAFSMGGLAIFGGRWFFVALPGILFLLLSTRMQASVLNFHYSMFAIPGLIAASVSGFRRLAMRERLSVRRLRLSVALAAVLYLFSSAAPGGGRFCRENYCLHPPSVRQVFPETSTEQIPLMHQLMGKIPPGAGAAVPYPLAAPLADRKMILFTEALNPILRNNDARFDEVEYVALPGRTWKNEGRYLVVNRGYRPVAAVGSLVLLTRSRQMTGLDPYSLGMEPLLQSCPSPLLTWSETGMVVCGTRMLPDGRVVIALGKGDQIAPRVHKQPFLLAIRDLAGTAQPLFPLWALDGMLHPGLIPPGYLVEFISEDPVRVDSADLVLLDSNGNVVARSPIPAGSK